MFDAHANFGYSTVAIAPVPANSGTSMDVAPGQGALFPAAPFNVTVWPSGVNPLASNAEIVRVTAVVGDTLTIVRAQEGTGAINIAVGYQIANTTTKLVFTDIENAINISAGTQSFQGPFTFSDAGGVSFGMDNGTVTASAPTGGGGVAISAGANSQSTGTIEFVNSNGITFGLDGAGQMTASHDGITSQSNPAFSASGGSSSFQTLVFANSNGLTFSNSNGSVIGSYTVPNTAGLISFVNISAGTTSNNLTALTFGNGGGVTFGLNGSVITASVPAGAAAGSIAAGTQTFGLGQAVFADGNGITFGLNAGTVTASHNGLTSQSNQAFSASGGSSAFQTIAFANSNGLTFSNSNGSVIASYTVPSVAGLISAINVSAGATSANLTAITFANGNGVTFGITNSVITASVNTTAGAGSIRFFEPAIAVSTGVAGINVAQQVAPYALPLFMSMSFARFLVSMVTSSTTVATLNSATATAAGSYLMTANLLIYTMGTGASSNSFLMVTSSSAGMTMRNTISITNSSQYTVLQAFSYLAGGVSSELSTQYATTLSNYALSTTLYSAFTGLRFLDIPLAQSFTAGNYWLALQLSTTSSTAGAFTAISRGLVFPNSMALVNQIDLIPLFMGGTSSNAAPFFYAGSFTTLGNVTTSAFNTSNVTASGSNRRIYFQLLAQ